MLVLPINTKSFSHTRGSVPLILIGAYYHADFFPHTWECTYVKKAAQKSSRLFPTHVGVYLFPTVNYALSPAFSHTRGSVPRIATILILQANFFPHTWECTYTASITVASYWLFPTHVGVILTVSFGQICRNTFSHASGSNLS